MRKILGLSEWETRVADYFSMAIACKMTHAAMLERRQSVIFEELYRKHGKRAVYSSYVSGYVAGLLAAGFSRLYRDHLEFCYMVDGVLYSTHRDSTHPTTEKFYAAGEGHRLNDSPSNHYWKGSDKPF